MPKFEAKREIFQKFGKNWGGGGGGGLQPRSSAAYVGLCHCGGKMGTLKMFLLCCKFERLLPTLRAILSTKVFYH